jgi:hypothetical protein
VILESAQVAGYKQQQQQGIPANERADRLGKGIATAWFIAFDDRQNTKFVFIVRNEKFRKRCWWLTRFSG